MRNFSRFLLLVVMLFMVPFVVPAQVVAVSSNAVIAPDPSTTGFYVRAGTITCTLTQPMTLSTPMVISIHPLQAMHRFSSHLVPAAFWNGVPHNVLAVVPMGDHYEVTLPVRPPNGNSYSEGDTFTVIGVTYDLLGFNPTQLLGDIFQVLISARSDVDRQFITFTSQTPTVAKVSVSVFRRVVLDLTGEDFSTIISVDGALDVTMARVKYDTKQRAAQVLR